MNMHGHVPVVDMKTTQKQEKQLLVLSVIKNSKRIEVSKSVVIRISEGRERSIH